MYKFGKRSLVNREGIDPRLIEIDDLAIKITRVDFGHGEYSGLRTAQQQNSLHKRGLSPNCDGYSILSEHQKGLALDSYAYVNGKASWEHHHLAMVAAAHLQAASLLGYKIEWGGLWKNRSGVLINGIGYGWDMAHIQLMESL